MTEETITELIHEVLSERLMYDQLAAQIEDESQYWFYLGKSEACMMFVRMLDRYRGMDGADYENQPHPSQQEGIPQ